MNTISSREHFCKLIEVFRKRGDFNSRIWEEYKSAQDFLVQNGLPYISDLGEALTKEEITVTANIVEILGKIGRQEGACYLERFSQDNFSPFFSYPYFLCKLTYKALAEIWSNGQEYFVIKNDLKKKSTKELLVILGANNYSTSKIDSKVFRRPSFSKRGELETNEYVLRALYEQEIKVIVQKILTQRGQEDPKQLTEFFGVEDQYRLMYIPEILVDIGSNTAVPYLRDWIMESAKRKSLWGINFVNIGGALIQLGEEEGVSYLKNEILSNEVHRDARILSACMLIKLGFKGVFHKNEVVVSSDAGMSLENKNVFEEIVSQLTETGLPVQKIRDKKSDLK